MSTGSVQIGNVRGVFIFQILESYSPILADLVIFLFNNFAIVLWFSGIPIVVIHNPNPGAAVVTLPNKKKWEIVVKGGVAGTKTIESITAGKVSVAGQTTMVLTQK